MAGDDQRKLTILCAWCGVVVQHGDDPANGAVSHGICEQCAPTVIAEIEERLRQARRPLRDSPESAGGEAGI